MEEPFPAAISTECLWYPINLSTNSCRSSMFAQVGYIKLLVCLSLCFSVRQYISFLLFKICTHYCLLPVACLTIYFIIFNIISQKINISDVPLNINLVVLRHGPIIAIRSAYTLCHSYHMLCWNKHSAILVTQIHIRRSARFTKVIVLFPYTLYVRRVGTCLNGA